MTARSVAAVALRLGGAALVVSFLGLAPWLAGAPGEGRAAGPALRASPGGAVQDFVFLGETRPVLVRVHVHVDGKPLESAWQDFMKHLFDYLDSNGDGVLSKEEAARAPSARMILSGGAFGRGPFGGGPPGGGPPPSPEDLGADKDGRVTLEGLARYYRSNGAGPFHLRFGAGQALPPRAVLFRGGRDPSPSAGEIHEALFTVLDTNGDGKLSREELAAAPAVLLRLDADDDEMVTPQELVTGWRELGGGDRPRPARPALTDSVVLVSPGGSPAGLVRRLQSRYGTGAGKPEGKGLRRADLGLDRATFDRLDADRDGYLDAEELGRFARRPPDVELTVRLGRRAGRGAPLDLVERGKSPSPLAARVKKVGQAAVGLDLGVTRVDLRAGAAAGRPAPQAARLLRRQYEALFKRADTDNNGFLDAAEARRNPVFRGLFRLMDRRGSGRLSLKDVLDWLDRMQELRAKAEASCVSMTVAEQGRGLFDLLDTNRDGRLGLREMRRAPELLKELDRDGDGSISRGEVPRRYQLELSLGSGNAGPPVPNVAALLARPRPAPPPAPRAGPLWFRKMDRNRDGDVSRREFLGTDEEFRTIDADGDGLISAEEAERADRWFRRKKEPGR